MSEKSIEAYSANLISPGFWSIEEGGVRSFLIEGLDKAMLVDTGYGTGDIRAFVETLTSLPVFVINTHTDRDHIGCNGSFEKVIMHPDEVNYYNQKKNDVNNDIEFVGDGAGIDIGTHRFEVIHIPGHTPGSIALLDREKSLLIGGDSVQTGAIFMFGEGRDLVQYITSMKKLEKMRDSFETIIASHGELLLHSDIIPELIVGAQRVLDGEIEGQVPPMTLPCKLYVAGRAKFLYNAAD